METSASDRRDGDHVIAEYDDSGLLRKYIYGARVDEPVCMIDVADNNKTYYYHFDGLGSVVALSNSNGDSCQSYEYSAYGQVAASDPNHPNPYMFTGRRFDIETGLYYYRARYYNPHIGRFMQTDPVGYSDGMNWYLYCRNNPLAFVDPSGALTFTTGGVGVMPWRVDPGSSLASKNAAQAAQCFINLIELGKIDTDIRVKILKKYLEGLRDLSDSLIKVPEEDKNGCRAFIEVVDYNDRNGDGLIDEKDLFKGETIDDLKSDPYWIEISGVRAPHRTGNVWNEAGGYYYEYQDTWNAVVLGVSRFYTGIPKGYLDPTFGDGFPYGTDPYYASDKLSKALKTTNELIEVIKEVEDIIED